MRSIVIALLACASVAGAQAGTVPAAPTAPVVKSGAGGELRVGGFMVNSERSMEFNGTVTTKNAPLKGIDVLARARFIGIQFKSLTSEFEGQPNITSADVRLLLFPRVFTVMVGAGRRALWSALNESSPTQFTIGMAGVSSTATIGGTGLRTNLSATMYIAGGPTSPGNASASASQAQLDKGMEGEASILYSPPKVPVYIQVGYRTEIFTAKSGTRTTPEEVRGLKIGGGLQLGGR